MSGIKESDQFDKELDKNALGGVDKIKRKDEAKRNLTENKRELRDRGKSIQIDKGKKGISKTKWVKDSFSSR